MHTMKWQLSGTVAVVLLCLATTARADDPSGTWTWSFTGSNGDTIHMELKLKMEGETLSGTVGIAGRKPKDIENGSFKDGDVTFQTPGRHAGAKTTTTYKGKMDGDTIKGTIKSTNEAGEEQASHDWEAKREKEGEKTDGGDQGPRPSR